MINFFLRKSILTIATIIAISTTLGMVRYHQANKIQNLPPLRIIKGEENLNQYSHKILETNDHIQPYINETTVRNGDTLSIILKRLKVSNSKEILKFLSANKNAKNMLRLLSGKPILAATDSLGNLIWLKYLHIPSSEQKGQIVSKYILLARDKNNIYTVTEKTESSKKQIRVAFGNINTSLFEATEYNGIPNFIAVQMADILKNKVDFLRGLRSGDHFIVIYEIQTLNGYLLGSGKVLAMEFKNHDKLYNAVWFDNNGKDKGSYYDFEGNNLQNAFLRNAVKFSRISSTFGRRLHPINKTWVDHKGVDYVAPAGTPIYATADGIVDFVGWQNGYGKVTILKHDNKYSTLYAHQSRIDPKILKGKKVYQGQLLGYVGSTGWATGPHLHYELRINNKPVNPLSVDLPTSKKIEQTNIENFKKKIAFYQTQINFLAKFNNETIKIAFNN
ncbi:metalloendopeptidase [Candidatus Kinetoplastibacterium desouzaii TCC079E]|uniref:Metalloendopeptidase n=1 Tax=Candidatus Kinetoplastidibacterium desouzai TCC079E TaxID=1208919 RepID=M1L323_9PROT|nr:M23 family metallopeptidase [Candidatus Kinetoplastibacterium desouzaii]AGF47153.1 metalloendopeptidase [Candidatus Kinetoplastibacterium desouzaii TCC079E]